MSGIDSVSSSKNQAISSPDAAEANAVASGDLAERELLPEPLAQLLGCGDPLARIAALLTQSGRQDRKEASKLALSEEKNIMAEGRERVQAMRDQADTIRERGYIAGWCEMAAGGFQLYGVGDKEREAVASGSSTAIKGFSKQYEDGLSGDAKNLDALAEEHKTLEDAAKRRYDEYRDQLRDARDSLDKIADLLRDARGAQNDAAKAAILRA